MPTADNVSYAAEPRTYLAGSAITRYRAVKAGADDNHCVPATAASVNLGIAVENQDRVDGPVPVAMSPGEYVWAEAGAAFASGVRLASDANGRLILATTGQAVTAISRRLAAALGDLVLVEIAPKYLLAP